ncbi:MAG: hypothetical protein Q7S86_05125 [bacterium]|nr:hypothetical protein [bacterium]
MLIKCLRFSIGIVFIWFGGLKIAGYNPVFDLVYYSMAPFLAAGGGLMVLGILEVVIGILLLVNWLLIFTHTVLLFHLLGTFSTFVFGWHVVFEPSFPVLSLGGEFVVKNMALAVSGLLVLIHEQRKKRA